jgi:hypothetical protein
MAIIGTILILVVLALLDRVETIATRWLRLPPDGKVPPMSGQDVDDGRSEDMP